MLHVTLSTASKIIAHVNTHNVKYKTKITNTYTVIVLLVALALKYRRSADGQYRGRQISIKLCDVVN